MYVTVTEVWRNQDFSTHYCLFLSYNKFEGLGIKTTQSDTSPHLVIDTFAISKTYIKVSIQANPGERRNFEFPRLPKIWDFSSFFPLYHSLLLF